MTAAAGPGRHLSPESFAEYLAADVPVVLPVPGEPPVSVFIDPVHRRIGLRSPVGADVSAPTSPLENLDVAVVSLEGTRQLEISSSAPELAGDVYAMLSTIADRIQLEAMPPLAAVNTTLDVWARLLTRRKRLSEDQEVGLFGELRVLSGLIVVMGDRGAVESWRGPQAEEHDFGFAAFDAEAKTTTSERRLHWVNSLTQLVATPGRPLWLVSLQVTRAGYGHGQTLPALIDDVRASAADEVARRRLEEVLASLGWSDGQRDLYTQRWGLRSQPRAFDVDQSFPVLSSASLATLRLDPSELTQVRYEIDVTHRPWRSPPEPLRGALAGN